jgi:dipeptidyl aminopeptidase/acylaminoacyl peptidase
MAKQKRYFGTWKSPFSPKLMAGGLGLTDVQWTRDGNSLVWLEKRPGQGGMLVAQTGVHAPRDLTVDLSVRAGVGYGGGEFTTFRNEIYFVSGERVYKQTIRSGSARPLTPRFGDVASPAISPDGSWLVYVHSYEGKDGLALVDADGDDWPRKLIYGTDFLMQPVWSPNGKNIAYIAWNHPLMPWDGTELRLLHLENDSRGKPMVTSMQIIAGNERVSIFQPEFSPDGRYLSYVSDQTGWGQIYLYDLQTATHTQLTQAEAEHGTPGWIQGLRRYGWTADSRALYFLRNEQGFHSLWRCDVRSEKSVKATGLEHYTYLSQIAVSPVGETVAMIAASSTIPPRVITYEQAVMEIPPVLSAEGVTPGIQVIVDEPAGEVIRKRSSAENIREAQLAKAQAISWTGHDGETVYGLYYAPASERFAGEGAPPLLVMIHGGPTSQDNATFDPEVQFFATRGYAVLQVNHRGSTGYGKAYMNKLRGQWGVYDVEDAASGASYLASQGLADPEKLVIIGGSAGGYTVLMSLVRKPGFYKAAICRYGISNQFTLALDTHWKFEERYNDSLLGVLPDAAAVYRERSPIFFADQISDPVAIFQGEDDIVVTKDQSEGIVASLRARGVPHVYHLYPGEGHGFRKPETLEHYYTSVIQFLDQYVVY